MLAHRNARMQFGGHRRVGIRVGSGRGQDPCRVQGVLLDEPSASRGSRPGRRIFVILALLWLAGVAMRMPLLAVPPVIPLIHDDLHMSETQVGALIGMPLTMFALAAVPGSLLIARLGVLRVAIVGLFITALAAARARRGPRRLDALCRDRR